MHELSHCVRVCTLLAMKVRILFQKSINFDAHKHSLERTQLLDILLHQETDLEEEAQETMLLAVPCNHQG